MNNAAGLKEDDLKIIALYTTDYGFKINQVLSSPTPSPTVIAYRERYMEILTSDSSLFSRHEANTPLYRGAEPYDPRIDELQIGDTLAIADRNTSPENAKFNLQHIIGTTMEERVARSYAGIDICDGTPPYIKSNKSSGYLLKFNNPEGIKLGSFSVNPNEREVILNPDQMFRIDKIEKLENNRIFFIQCPQYYVVSLDRVL